MLDAFTLPVKFMVAAAAIFLLVKLGGLPGKIAAAEIIPRLMQSGYAVGRGWHPSDSSGPSH